MKRIPLILAGALALLLVASVGTAAAGGVNQPAEKETPKINTTCTTSSKNVIGNKVTITVTGKNVAQSQKMFAQCPTVKKVANKNLSLRIEKPLVFEGFRCTPRVLTGGEGTVEPQKVAYNCLFRGADTATEIVLKFKVTYNTD
ncbi:MAG: hypothetical protein JST59_23545 [Actinobacteria bacterium]|nr:hypothetical protein [Actinomycetota bacterium]